MEEQPICEWHAIDVVGGEAWVWASTREDAIQQASAVPGIIEIEYCERVYNEKSA